MITLAMLVLLSYAAPAQQGVDGQNRQLNHSKILRRANPHSDTTYKELKTGIPATVVRTNLEGGTKFTIVDETLSDYVLTVWNYGDPEKDGRYSEDSVTGETYFYLIPKNELDKISKILYKRWSATYGVTSFPFKYRPQTGVFEPTFSLSATGGVKYNFDRTNDDYSISFLLGVGPSSVSLTKDNTAPWSGVTTSTQSSAVTLSFGMVFQMERVQIGLSLGMDSKLDGNREEWIYQGKDWLSLGIGLSLFSNSLQKSINTQ